MGDTGSELVGLILLIMLAFSIIGVAGFKFINRLEAKQMVRATTINNGSKWKIVVIGVILLTTLGASVSLAILLRPTSPSYGTGQPIRIGDWVIEITQFGQPGSLLHSGSVEQNDIKALGSWLEVEVTIKNAGLGPIVPKLADFEADDSQNNAFLPNQTAQVSAYATSKGSINPSNEISPGDTAKVWLVYDLPANSSGLELIFKQGSMPHFRLTSGTAR